MSKQDDSTDTLVNQLLLDIKALMIIQQSDATARDTLERNLLSSHDEYVTRFLKLISKKKPSSRGGYVVVAVGEMLLSALLIVGGLVLFAPAVAGLDVPSEVYSYFVQVLSYINVGGPFFLLTKVLEFALAVILLLAAVFTLRQASRSLKDAGLTIEPAG